MKNRDNATNSKKSWLYQFLIFLLSGLIISALLSIIPVGRTHLIIDMSTDYTGTSHIFLSEQGNYSSKNSHSVVIQPGRNMLKFPLGISKPTIRWDALASGTNVDVHNIYLTVLGMKLRSVQVGLSPIANVLAVKPKGEGLLVVMGNEIINPQLTVDFNKTQLYQQRIVICGITGLLIAFIFLFLYISKNTFFIAFNKADRSLAAFAAQGRSDGCNPRELGVLIFIAALFYGYFLSTFSLSIDNEAAALRQNPSVWVSQGRWFTYLIEKFLLQQPSVPFAPFVILIIAFSVSYIALLRAHGYKESWKTYLTYPVFCAFPTWWAIATFYSNTPALAIGLILISFSAYLYFGQGFTGNITIHNSYARNSVIILMLACAIAAYQSLILMFASYACGILLARCLRMGRFCRISPKVLTMTVFRLMLLVIIAIIFYEVINKLTQKFIERDSGYIAKAFFNYDKTLTDPFRVLRAIFREQLAIYGGSAKRYGANLAMNGVIMFLATIVILHKNGFKSPVTFILWLGVLFAPFALHAVTGGEPLPMRTLIPIAYVSWLSCIILLSGKRSISILVSIILVGLLQIKIVGVTSQYIASATLVQSHDRILAADIYSRIGESSTDFDPDAPLKMDFYGRKSFSTIYANAWQGTMQGSFFSWDKDNIHRIINFMQVMGYQNIVVPSDAERKALNLVFDKMPVWPAAGSVKKVGDIYLIRLSKEPDPTHAL